MKTIKVSKCSGCAFLKKYSEYCGAYCALAKTDFGYDESWMRDEPPPSWCPLRNDSFKFELERTKTHVFDGQTYRGNPIGLCPVCKNDPVIVEALPDDKKIYIRPRMACAHCLASGSDLPKEMRDLHMKDVSIYNRMAEADLSGVRLPKVDDDDYDRPVFRIGSDDD